MIFISSKTRPVPTIRKVQNKGTFIERKVFVNLN
jgi:hypothetical protein